ncbi:MAG: pyridoxal-phosphate dependent enzyme [Candidatus Thorarchaeota archaeon]|nr:MAG: pyridoxal-phosphate dependent enzyme [Candidatus Thorarchaeota archaeon]
MALVTLEMIEEAEDTIRGLVLETPLIRSEKLSEITKGEVFLKLENTQHTNSFKIRGALNRMSRLSPGERERGVVTASSGNHAQAVARAAQELNIPATIVIPANVSGAKLEKIRRYDVDIVLEGGFDEVEARARELAEDTGKPYISPYNDADVIAGQGTIGLEIIRQLNSFDSIIVPVGGGGLISGIAIAVKALRPETHVMGVQTEGAATMYQSWLAGKIVQIEEFETLAEAFLGGLEPDSMTFDLIAQNVDELVLTEEVTVAKAIRLLWLEHNQIVEGAGATSIGPIVEDPERFKGMTVVAIVSGGNIEQSLYDRIVDGIWFESD